MKIQLLLIPFLLFLGLVSCHKEEPLVEEPDPPCYFIDCDTTSILEVVWQKPLGPDTSEFGSYTPIIFNDKVAFDLHFYQEYEILKMRNAENGEKIWEWEASDSGVFPAGSLVKKDDVLFATTGNNVFSISLEEGNSNWESTIPSPWVGQKRINVFGDLLFHTRNLKGSGQGNTLSSLVKTNIHTGDWMTVLEVSRDDGYSPNLYPPSGWIHPNGDTILVFQNRSYGWYRPEGGGRIDLYAYNLTKNSILWEKKNLDPDGNSNVNPPTIFNNKVFFQGWHTLYCFDLLTGKQEWEKKFEGISDLGTSNLLIAEEKLIVNLSDFKLVALNSNDGSVIWKNENTGANCSTMTYHDGLIYFTCIGTGKIYAVDVETGEEIWEEDSPNREKGFQSANFAYSGVAIHPELGLAFCSDYYFAMAIKLPER